jgi:hypothetical protein
MAEYAPMVHKPSWKLKPDFFARRTHFIDHLLPVWKELRPSERGTFYIPESLEEYAALKDFDFQTLHSISVRGNKLLVRPPGMTPLVCCAYNDMEQGWHQFAMRPFFLMEHGVGLSFEVHPGYGGGEGLRSRVSLFLPPNQNIYDKTAKTFPSAPQVIIGTPKMDNIRPTKPMAKDKPIVGISFHWNGSAVCPEAGNALDYYLEVLPELAEQFYVIGHGHPKIINKLIPIYRDCGITDIELDFNKVMERCDIYINDASSTMYEFSCTGKPVIILNAPWFRRDVHWGIRFWDYTDIGICVDKPVELLPAVRKTAEYPSQHYPQRLKMIEELYPYLGHSAKRAARAITEYIRSKRDGTAFSIT